MKLKWTYETIKKEALKYDSIPKFQKGSGGAFMACRRLGLQAELCSHMNTKKLKKWSNKMLFEEALKYKTRNSFKKSSHSAYQLSMERGILKVICGHMPFTQIKWTDEMILKEALRYQTKADFVRGSPKAQDSAKRRGIMKEVCAHMSPAPTGKRGVKYYLEHPKAGGEDGIYYGLLFTHIDGIQFVKMGITSQSIFERYRRYNKSGWSYEVITEYKTTNLATAYIEKNFINKFKNDYHYQLSDEYAFGGRTELFTLDIIPILEEFNSNT